MKVAADPKMRCHQKSFDIWRVTEAISDKKNTLKNKSHYFFSFLDMHFVDTNTVILKKKKYISPKMCLYIPGKQPQR